MGAAAGTLCGQLAMAATTAWFAQRYYPIPYETPRLFKAGILALACFGLGMGLRTSSAWANLAIAVTLVAAFPALLLGLGFLQRWELAALRQMSRWPGTGVEAPSDRPA